MTTVSYVGALPLIIHSMRAKYGSCPFCYHTTPRIPLVANIGEHVLRQVNCVKQCKDQWDDGDCKVSAQYVGSDHAVISKLLADSMVCYQAGSVKAVQQASIHL